MSYASALEELEVRVVTCSELNVLHVQLHCLKGSGSVFCYCMFLIEQLIALCFHFMKASKCTKSVCVRLNIAVKLLHPKSRCRPLKIPAELCIVAQLLHHFCIMLRILQHLEQNRCMVLQSVHLV